MNGSERGEAGCRRKGRVETSKKGARGRQADPHRKQTADLRADEPCPPTDPKEEIDIGVTAPQDGIKLLDGINLQRLNYKKLSKRMPDIARDLNSGN